MTITDVYIDGTVGGSIASGSHDISDYGAVNDGVTDATAAIQTALDSNAGTIVIPDGTYLISGLTVSSHKKITGTGTLKMKAATDGYMINIIGTSTVVFIDGITIDGNGSTQGTHTYASVFLSAIGTSNAPASLTIENVTFQNGYWADLSVKNDSTRSTVESLLVRGCRFLGGIESSVNSFAPRYLDIRSPINYVISNNSFDRLSTPDGYGRAGILVYDGFSTTFESARGVISGNIFNKVGRSCLSSTLGCIDLYDSGRATSITGNTLIGCYGRGIQAKSDGYALSITGNTIDGMSGGVDGTVAGQIIINGSVSSHPNSNGMISVSGNTCLSSGNDGISVTGDGFSDSDGYASTILISNNTIKNATRRSVAVISVSDATISGNSISGSIEGIYSDASQGILNITGNTILSTTNGIDISITNPLANFLIVANYVKGQSNKGIVVASGISGTIAHNKVDNTTSSAIYVANTTGEVKVINNQSNSTTAFQDGGSNTNLVTGSASWLSSSDTSTIFKDATLATGLTITPLATGSTTIQFATGSTPTVNQAQTTTGTGANMTIAAQQTTHDGSNGGSLLLSGGPSTGTTGTGGSVALRAQTGNTANGSILFSLGTTAAYTLTPAPSGATQISAASTCTSVKLLQALLASGTGSVYTLQAQNVTTGTGGILALTSGSGSVAAGALTLGTGGTTRLTANATGVITIANLSTGVLHSDSSGNLTSSAVVLSGSEVSGVLPIANQASQTMAGDVTGTTAASVVAKLNGTTVPATPATGNKLVATGSTTAIWRTDSYAFGIAGRANFTTTSDTATNVTSFSFPVLAGESWRFSFDLSASCSTTSGAKFALGYTGTATDCGVIIDSFGSTGTSVSRSILTAANTLSTASMLGAGTVAPVHICGLITATTDGTATLQVAAAVNGDTITVQYKPSSGMATRVTLA